MDTAIEFLDLLLNVPTAVLYERDRRNRNGHILTTLFEAAGSTRETLKASLSPSTRQTLQTRLHRLECKLDEYDEAAFAYLKRGAGHTCP